MIEFELKDFSKEFNQNKEFKSVTSPIVKLGNFEWNLMIKRFLNEINLGIYLGCSSEKKNFPVFAEYKLFIVNQKDERKHKIKSINLKISIVLLNLYSLYHSIYLAASSCFEYTSGFGYSPFISFEVNFKRFTKHSVCLIVFYLIKKSF